MNLDQVYGIATKDSPVPPVYLEYVMIWKEANRKKNWFTDIRFQLEESRFRRLKRRKIRDLNSKDATNAFMSAMKTVWVENLVVFAFNPHQKCVKDRHVMKLSQSRHQNRVKDLHVIKLSQSRRKSKNCNAINRLCTDLHHVVELKWQQITTLRPQPCH